MRSDLARRVGLWGAALVCLLLLLACGGKGTGPTRSSLLFKSVQVNNCSTLVTYAAGLATPETVYTAPAGSYIGCFCYAPDRQALYLVLSRPNAGGDQQTVSLVRRQPDGTITQLYGYTACTDCEGARTFGGLYVSPDGRYLAIDDYGYEWSDLRVFDLTQQAFLNFNCRGRDDYTVFLLWHPTKHLLYGGSGLALIEYDVDASHCQELATPNICDYLTEAELLHQGYAGERIDYEKLLGYPWPGIIGWHPGGWHFAYERNDSLYLFNVKDSTESLIYGGRFNCRPQHFGVEWDEGDRTNPPPLFCDRDVIAPFDSTILDTVAPLNDSISYIIGKSGPISYLECQWGNRVTTSRYFFRGSATVEKFHIAELDYLLWEFALDVTPGFWFLTTYYTYWYLTDSAYTAQYQEMVADYRGKLQMFRAIRYPPVFAGKPAAYSELVARDYRFEAAMAAYLANRDRAAFADTVALLIPGLPSPFMDTVATWLEEFQLGDRNKIASVYMQLKNRYFNYYGKVIGPDVADILNAYGIEQFNDDIADATISQRKARTANGRQAWEIRGR